jgi:hypothetical protein
MVQLNMPDIETIYGRIIPAYIPDITMLRSIGIIPFNPVGGGILVGDQEPVTQGPQFLQNGRGFF